MHTRHVFGSACREVAECSPAVPDLQMLSLFGITESDASALERPRNESRGPTLALGVNYVLTHGEMAEHSLHLIVSDVDSTFICDEAIDMLVDTTGSGSWMATIMEAAMNDELDFAEALTERVATLKSLSVNRVESITNRIESISGAKTLVATAHTRGYIIDLVLDGFIEVIGGPARHLGVDCVLANRLEMSDGALIGRTGGETVTRERKVEALRCWSEGDRLLSADLPGGSDSPKDSNLPKNPTPPSETRGREDADARSHDFPLPHERIDLSETVAAGNSTNDPSIMKIVGLSVAVCAEPAVFAAVNTAVTRPRLDILATIFDWDVI